MDGSEKARRTSIRYAVDRLTRLRSGEAEETVYPDEEYFSRTDQRNIDRAILADAYLAIQPQENQ